MHSLFSASMISSQWTVCLSGLWISENQQKCGRTLKAVTVILMRADKGVKVGRDLSRGVAQKRILNPCNCIWIHSWGVPTLASRVLFLAFSSATALVISTSGTPSCFIWRTRSPWNAEVAWDWHAEKLWGKPRETATQFALVHVNKLNCSDLGLCLNSRVKLAPIFPLTPPCLVNLQQQNTETWQQTQTWLLTSISCISCYLASKAVLIHWQLRN